MFKYQQSQRQELIEFRNYVRQVTSAKMSSDKSPSRSNPTKQLEFILKSTQLQQSVQKPTNNVSLITRPNYETSYYPRSTSQTFVQFDANTWNENTNSLSRVKTQTTVSVSELVRIGNALGQMSKKEVSGLSSKYEILLYFSYLHTLHELEQTVSTLLKRID